MTSVLVTGAGGFVGRALCASLSAKGHSVTAAVRQRTAPTGRSVPVGDIGSDTKWGEALAGVDTVIHLAARAHILDDRVADPLAEFRRVNTAGTMALARQARDAGVRRFIFVSSIGVNGAETYGTPYRANDAPAPHSPYAISKHEAELGLWQLAAESGLEVTIVRPPLVIGPGAPGNFLRLLDLVDRGLPLPFGAIDNRRSFVALDNLTDLIGVCLDHSRAANQTFLVSDGEDLSTTELLRRVGKALNKPAKLIPFPASVMRLGAKLLGKSELAQRLFGSLQVDIGPTRERLGWAPRVTIDDALESAARYRREVARR